MKLIQLLFVFFSISIYAQKDVNAMHFDENSIYIIGRSTKSKQDIIAKDFNLKDTLTTHVGIGIVENQKLIIYNITNDIADSERSAFVKENINEFLKVKDLLSFSIWSCKSDTDEIKKAKDILSQYKEKIIEFDYDFLINNEKLYCSEFVCEVLKKTNAAKFQFDAVQKKLNPFYSQALKREILTYIPVDFFLSDTKFNLLYKFDSNKTEM